MTPVSASAARPEAPPAAPHFQRTPLQAARCCLKNAEDGAREGAEFIAAHLIRVTETSFEDFASGASDEAANRRMLGIDR